MKRRTQAERDERARWFADEPAVLAAARAAAVGRGSPELIEAVAYCLVVLAVKDDHAIEKPDGARRRSYELDPDAATLPEQLAEHARHIVLNLVNDVATYETIRDELRIYSVRTLSGMVRLPDRHDDLRDAIADKLARKLGDGPRVADMTRARAREGGIPAGQYAFRSPLSRWVQTTTTRDRLSLVPAIPVAPELRPLEGEDLLRHEQALGEALLRETATIVSDLEEARGLIGELIGRALSASSELHAQLPPHVKADVWAQIRPQFVAIIEKLDAERRALTGALAFVVLAMRRAVDQQCVAAVSLRLTRNDRSAVQQMTATMRALLEDGRHPTPMLVAQTRAASFGAVRSRVGALEELRGAASEQRAAMLAPVAAMLDGLPESVADLQAIADAATAAVRRASEPPITYEVVRTYRSVTFAELGAVNVGYEAAYARYASTRRRP